MSLSSLGQFSQSVSIDTSLSSLGQFPIFIFWPMIFPWCSGGLCTWDCGHSFAPVALLEKAGSTSTIAPPARSSARSTSVTLGKLQSGTDVSSNFSLEGEKNVAFCSEMIRVYMQFQYAYKLSHTKHSSQKHAPSTVSPSHNGWWNS